MKRKAVNGNVVVEQIKEEKRSASGLYLVEGATSRGKINKAKVFMVDEDVEKEAYLRKGDTVYHRPGKGYEVELDGSTYLILKNTDLELVESEELA